MNEKLQKSKEESQREIRTLSVILSHDPFEDSALDDVLQNVKPYLGVADDEWINEMTEDGPKRQFLNKLKDCVDKCIEHISKEDFSATELIQNVSDGSLLQGIYYTSDTNDMRKRRDTLIDIRNECQFECPDDDMVISKRIPFFDDEHRNDFFRMLNLLGFTGSEQFCCKNDSMYINLKKKDLAKSFVSLMSCMVFPVSKWKPEMASLCLSKSVVLHLQIIEKYLKDGKVENAKKSCNDFFEKYGSHFRIDSVHFGGIFTTEAIHNIQEPTSVAFTIENLENALSFAIRSKYHYLSSEKGETLEAFVEQALKKVDSMDENVKVQSLKINTLKIGGPQGVDIAALWKKTLQSKNVAWEVIDRGKSTPDGLVGVWRFLGKHASEIENHERLSWFIYKTWQQLSGLNTKDILLEAELATMEGKLTSTINETMEKIKLNENVGMIVGSLEELLKHLENIENCLGQKYIESKICKEQKRLMNILENIMSMTLTTKGDKLYSCLEIIVHKMESCHISCDRNLKFLLIKGRQLPKLVLFMNKMSRIEDLLNLLEELLTFIKSTWIDDVENGDCQLRIERNISFELKNLLQGLLSSLQNTGNVSHYILLLALVVPFGYDRKKHYFRIPMTIEKLEKFIRQSEDELKALTKVGTEAKREAYSFLTLITSIKELTWPLRPMASQDSLRRLYYNDVVQIFKHHFCPIDTRVQRLALENVDVDFESIRKSLIKFIDDRTAETIEISWKYFEDIQGSFFDNIEFEFSSSSKEDDTCRGALHCDLTKMLDILGLSRYYPGKLTLKEVFSIRDNMFTNADKITDLPWVIIRKIISLNSDYRERVLDDFVRNVCGDTSSMNSVEMGDILAEITEDETQICTEDNTYDFIHPQDLFLVIYQSCDPFLKKILAQKIALCQFALPLIITEYINDKPMLLLWPLREIFIDSKLESVVKQPLKAVSFIRLGKILESKSQLINNILRDQNETHNTFFHRHCARGMQERKLSNGNVEISWYVPTCTHKMTECAAEDQESTQKGSLKFEETMTILNLRGDAHMYKPQLEILLQISTIVVVLVEYDNLNDSKYEKDLSDIHKSTGKTFLLSSFPSNRKELQQFVKVYGEKTSMDKSKTKMISLYDNAKKRNYNVDEVRLLLTRNIKDALKTTEITTSIEQLKTCLPGRLVTDEEETACVNAKEMSDRVFADVLYTDDGISNKDTILPLHGEHLWHECSKKQKDLKRVGKEEVYDRNETVLKSIIRIRERQVEACNNAKQTMAHFIEILIRNLTDEDKVSYFLSWFRQNMDNESRKILPRLLDEFYDAFKAYESLGSKDSENSVNESEKKIARASFGLEHFFREMGQIFESFTYCREKLNYTIKPKTLYIVQYLPVIAARLLLLGHPLEVMDGDAANVPLIWLKAVFSELQIMIGDKKCFCISVLGVQSSGKSTLLNTMFGLQFAVSAGRCTRGIFAQLVPIDPKHTTLKFDYALVIDTEGLHAPEMAGEKFNHDNELATLVIGLGDVVIINIKGETIADMENVLQIVVHGLIRLKQANNTLQLNQSSIFIHQNVSASDADKKMMQGNQKIVQNLDRMTEEVAKQEHVTGVYSFKHVIAFNPLKHVKYIPDLWHGTPPMAPASSKYSAAVIDVAKCILQEIAPTKVACIFMRDTILHLESLWEGILAEDFVFSFRNCLEVKAYRKLESEYQKLRFELEALKLDWWNEYVKPRFSMCEEIAELEVCASDLVESFKGKMELKTESVINRFIKFAETSELKEHMVNWKEGKVRCLEAKASYLIIDLSEKISQEKGQYKINLGKNDRRFQEERQINEKAKGLAIELRGTKPSQQSISENFENLWTSWIADVQTKYPQQRVQSEETLRKELISVLREEFSTDKRMIEMGLQKKSLCEGENIPCLRNSFGKEEITFEDIQPILTTFSGIVITIDHWLSKNNRKYAKKTMNTLETIFASIDTDFEDLLKQDTKYQREHFSKILKYISEGFSVHRSSKNCTFTLTKKLHVKVALHVSRFCFAKYLALNEQYEETHSVLSELESHKPRAIQLFIDTLDAKTEQIIAKNVFCNELKELIQERVERGISGFIQKEMRKMFNHEKHHLLKKILSDLAEIDDFKIWIDFIARPDTFALKWLTEKTDKEFFTAENSSNNKYVLYCNRTIAEIIEEIKKTLEQSIVNDPTTIQKWVIFFEEGVKNLNLLFSPVSFQHVMNHTIEDLKDFSSCIIDDLGCLEESLQTHFLKHSPENMKWKDGKTPYSGIMESLWGCTEKCPFCGEPCQVSELNHYTLDKKSFHMCLQHRPEGVGGVHYVMSLKMCIESCNYSIQSSQTMRCGKWCDCQCFGSHPLKEYKRYMPSWDISPSTDMAKSNFWVWFLTKFKNRLANYYEILPPDIPDSWSVISKEEAIQSLSIFD